MRSLLAAFAVMMALAALTHAACNDKDKAENCGTLKAGNYCENEIYKLKLQEQCGKTCGCKECADKKRNCNHWKKNGYCDNNSVSEQKKIDNCRETCGKCNS